MLKKMILALAMAGLPAIAGAQSVEDFKPSSLNQPGKQYPAVNSERKVRAQINAPGAKSVQLDLGRRYDLKNDGNGLWTGESAPQDEGFHYYQLIIDGAAVPDPGTRYFYGASRWGSGVEVPAKDEDFYAVKNVPHGQVREHHYFSKIANANRRCFVYTPPDYDKDPAKKFPVLYLQHGSGEDETGWAVQGRANFILDNLIAEKKAVPMIIVMENGNNPSQGGARGGMPRGGGGSAGPAPARAGGMPAMGRQFFEQVLIDEVIPMIDSTYRTLSDKDHRAMAGLSMGANQTITITFNNLDKFAYIGAFSGTSNYPSTNEIDVNTFMGGKFKDGAALNKQIKLFWLGLGTKEPSPFPGSVGAFKTMLDKQGVKYVWFDKTETAHEWQTWRRSLQQYASLLFKD